MASSSITLSLCSSLASHCKISSSSSSPPPPPSLSLTQNAFPLLSSSSSSSPPLPNKTHFKLTSFAPVKPSSVAKVSDTEAPPVIEAEFYDPPTTTTEIATTTPEPPAKREEVFAVVMIGSRQYIVFPGRYIYTQRLKGANLDDKIILNKVLLVGTKTSTYIGKPVVPNAAVHAVVEEQGLNPKVVVFKYKKKKKYRRNIGHRQPNTRIRITGITGYQDSPAVTLDS